MGKHEVSRITDPIEIVVGFSADHYSFHATVRERDAAEPIVAIGQQSMEIVTVEELAAELMPWIRLSDSHREWLETDRKIELYKADREYRQEKDLAREQPGLERD